MKFEITPSLESYKELIKFCCSSRKVQLALDIVNQISQDSLNLSIDMLNCILHAIEETMSVICAYAMLNDSRKMNVKPVAGMYNAIMAGYFREKKISAGLRVLKQMELDSVKPDPQTYSYLIAYCDNKFISAVSCIIATSILVMLQMGIPVKSLNELRSALVSALASHGQMADAVDTYEEIKQSGGDLEPRAVLSLMECLHSERDLSLMLQLLEELHDQGYWIEGCCRVISFCVRKKHLSTAVHLLKQLKDKFCDDELAAEVLFDEAFAIIAEEEPADVQFGVDLLQAIKSDIGISPSRKCLDFILNAYVKAKDLQNSLLIWKEYEIAGLIMMYQALLACGDHKSAEAMRTKIPKDDPDVRDVIRAFQATYPKSTTPAKPNKRPQQQENK
ncbi:hypothetical protein SLEP1_g57899 [Rubroshorea leprosula]|uniref:Pentatricopeptide repeat-containing protein n=1 Tax=Rubroshorea leprosula TaxID=152421 RepID=A0AAV5MN08_9ROSI|nr:hypothetical protein SLEP1_g57899 [Rubroshorea leprosula]